MQQTPVPGTMRMIRSGGSSTGLSAIAVVAVWAASSRADAQTYEGARLLGFANARRALASANDAIYVNPAGTAMARLYSLELGYVDDLLGSDRRFNASVVDSQAGPVAGGLAYTYASRRAGEVASPDRRLEGHRAELSMATLVSEAAAVGATVRYLSFDVTEGDRNVAGAGFSGLQLDIGIQGRLWQGLSLGLVGYNLNKSDRPEMPLSWGAGIGWQSEVLSLEADVRYSAQVGALRYSFAAGVALFEMLLLRAGGTYDNASKTWAISGGAGLSLERIALDIGFRRCLGDRGLEGYGDERVFGASLRMMML